MNLRDAFVLDDVRRTSDGYLTAFARVARTGIQEYRGYELGRPDLDVVRVYRPPEEVFAPDAMNSMAHRPVTLRHPRVPVTAKNWKKYSGGQTGAEVVRDGEYVRVPMVLMDQKLIDAYERDGIKELSLGYSTDIKWRTGVVDAGQPDAGQTYDAVQTAIRGNHLAVVPDARGGKELRIGDGRSRFGGSTQFRELIRRLADMEEMDDDEEGDYVGDGALYDTEFSEAEREKLAKTGAAMPGGGFPIRNAEDLHHAMQAIGRAKDPSAARAHIRARAKALGLEGELSASFKDSSPRGDDYVDCPQCGADVPPDSLDCPECGHKMNTRDGATYMTKIVIDGVPVNVADEQTAAIIERHVALLTKQLADAKKDMEKIKNEGEDKDKDCADAKKTIAARDGEIAVLKKQVADAAVTPEKLDVLVKDRLIVIDAASPLLDKTFSFDGKTVEAIRRAAVEAHLGDAAKGMDDATVSGAFAALTADAVRKGGGSQPIRQALSIHGNRSAVVTDARQAAYDEKQKRQSEMWRKPATA